MCLPEIDFPLALAFEGSGTIEGRGQPFSNHRDMSAYPYPRQGPRPRHIAQLGSILSTVCASSP